MPSSAPPPPAPPAAEAGEELRRVRGEAPGGEQEEEGPRRSSETVIDALDVMSGYLRGKLAEQRRANTTADDDLAGRVEMATTTRGRITQLKMGI